MNDFQKILSKVSFPSFNESSLKIVHSWTTIRNPNYASIKFLCIRDIFHNNFEAHTSKLILFLTFKVFLYHKLSRSFISFNILNTRKSSLNLQAKALTIIELCSGYLPLITQALIMKHKLKLKPRVVTRESRTDLKKHLNSTETSGESVRGRKIFFFSPLFSFLIFPIFFFFALVSCVFDSIAKLLRSFFSWKRCVHVGLDRGDFQAEFMFRRKLEKWVFILFFLFVV